MDFHVDDEFESQFPVRPPSLFDETLYRERELSSAYEALLLIFFLGPLLWFFLKVVA